MSPTVCPNPQCVNGWVGNPALLCPDCKGTGVVPAPPEAAAAIARPVKILR